MEIRDVSVKEIDSDCEEFRISEELEVPALLESIREIGQLNPAVLLERSGGKVIVCGFRRIRAALRLGARAVPSRVLRESDFHSLHPLEFALRDNLSFRELNPLEKARALDACRRSGLPSGRIVETCLPLLGLPARASVLQSQLRLHEAHPELRRLLHQNALTVASAEALAEMPVPLQARLASLMSRVRLSASLQRKVLGLLRELAAGEGVSWEALLDHVDVRAALEEDGTSPFEKGERLHEALYRRLHPRLVRARDRFSEQRSRLGLPGAIRLAPHPFFETAEIRVEFSASGPERFRELASSLERAAQSPAIEALFVVE